MTAPAATAWLEPFLREWRPGTGEARDVREPATGRHLLTLPGSTPDDVARAAAAAKQAQPAWAATSYAERAAILRRAAEVYETHREELGTWTQRETGAVHNKMHHEQNFTVGELNAAAAMPFQPYGQLVPTVVPGRLSMLRRVPAGVIGAITPWNSPSVLGMRVVAPALALGNAVILKPDPQTPVCGGAMFEAVFREAGLPEGLLHVVVGGADVGEAIVTDANVDRLSFTGSTAAGRRVGALAGGLLKRVSLELGGNNAFVVLDDADVEAAASAGAFASFQFQGQVCFATGRHIVHRSVAGAYVDLLTEKAMRLRLGDPYREDVDLGPIINQKQLERVDGIVRRSVEGGARVVVGGTHDGLFYRPTVLTEVTAEHAAWREEIFGPVAPVVTFDSDDEALALANDSEYGLTGAVYSRSISRGLAFAQRIRSGMVHVNDQTVNDEATIPFGGMGASGNGARFGGPANWDEFTEGSGHRARRSEVLPALEQAEGGIDHRGCPVGGLIATASRVVSASDYPVSAATGNACWKPPDARLRPNALARGLLNRRIPSSASTSTTTRTPISPRSCAASRMPRPRPDTWSSPAARSAIRSASGPTSGCCAPSAPRP
jgi:benzaldehyde dehydrogenase (NAD)